MRKVTAVGSEKMAVYDDLAAEERIRVMDKGVTRSVAGTDLSQPPMSYRYGDITAPYVAADEPLSVQDAHFVQCLATGSTPATDGANGLAVVEVLEAAQLSLRMNRAVSLYEISDPEGVSDTRLTLLDGQRRDLSPGGLLSENGWHRPAAAAVTA